MNLRCARVSILVFVLCSSASSAVAWDGQRKGFTLGIGVGGGVTSYTQKVVTLKSDQETEFGVQADFKIGYAPSNQVNIFYTCKESWFGMKNLRDEHVTIGSSVTAAAVTYYMSPEVSSWFVTGGLGLAGWSTRLESDARTYYGIGLIVGGGYEFSRHWYVEADLTWGQTSDKEDGIEVSTDALTFMITINVLGY